MRLWRRFIRWLRSVLLEEAEVVHDPTVAGQRREAAAELVLGGLPEVPASPNAQDAVDALKLLGLVTQAVGDGGGEFTPADIAGLEAWWVADSLAYADDDPVNEWADVTGHGYVLEPTSANTGQIVYKTNILNGEPVVRFGVGPPFLLEYLNEGVINIPQPLTWVGVGKIYAENLGRPSGFMEDGLNALGPQIWDPGTSVMSLMHDDNAVTRIDGTTNIKGAFHIIVGIANGASSKLYVDGGSPDATGDAGPAAIQDGFAIIGGVPFEEPPLGMDVAQQLIYGVLVSDANLNLLGNYLADKYALSWTDI